MSQARNDVLTDLSNHSYAPMNVDPRRSVFEKEEQLAV